MQDLHLIITLHPPNSVGGRTVHEETEAQRRGLKAKPHSWLINNTGMSAQGSDLPAWVSFWCSGRLCFILQDGHESGRTERAKPRAAAGSDRTWRPL